MSVIKVVGKNIKSLMTESNISIRKMAEVVNVTHPTMSKYINGDQAIDSDKLYVIADYFNKNFDYFFHEDHKELSLLFRADKPSVNLEQKDYDFMLRKIEDYIDITEDKNMRYIPQSYSLKVEGSSLSKEIEDIIEEVALEQRRLLDIEEIIPENYFSTISKIGINVLCFELQNNTLYGSSSFSKEHGSFIFVNSNKTIPDERQIFSLIHEWGHLLFHRNEYQDPKHDPLYENTRGNLREKIVDTFAGYFLLPKAMVEKYIKDKNNRVNLNEMKWHFKVSMQDLYVALYKYGLIAEEKYRDFWRIIKSRKIEKIEPSPLKPLVFQQKNEKFISEIRSIYESDDISINKIAEILELDMQSVRKLVKKWGIDNNENETLL